MFGRISWGWPKPPFPSFKNKRASVVLSLSRFAIAITRSVFPSLLKSPVVTEFGISLMLNVSGGAKPPRR